MLRGLPLSFFSWISLSLLGALFKTSQMSSFHILVMLFFSPVILSSLLPFNDVFALCLPLVCSLNHDAILSTLSPSCCILCSLFGQNVFILGLIFIHIVLLPCLLPYPLLQLYLHSVFMLYLPSLFFWSTRHVVFSFLSSLLRVSSPSSVWGVNFIFIHQFGVPRLIWFFIWQNFMNSSPLFYGMLGDFHLTL